MVQDLLITTVRYCQERLSVGGLFTLNNLKQKSFFDIVHATKVAFNIITKLIFFSTVSFRFSVQSV